MFVPLFFVPIITPLAFALSPTGDDPYPHLYQMEGIVYRVSTPSSIPEWFDEYEEENWCVSSDYPTEKDLINSHWIQRIHFD
jgi:hypothetical protein